MHITPLGLVLVPLSLLWILNPIRLLQLTLFSAIFEAGAALVLGGSFGLQPAMVPGLLFIGYIVVQYALGMRYPGEGPVLRTMLPLVGLSLYALLSISILPDAFAGRIMVWPQRTDILAPGFVPLQFSFGNITQTLYLAVDVVLAVSVAIFVTRNPIPYHRIIKAYMTSGYVVVALVLWQFGNRVANVPFPNTILYSNPSWVIVRQSLGSVPRMQGPFTEPSALAFYLCGVTFCCFWLTIRGHRIMKPGLLLALSMACTVLSTSTTGILVTLVALLTVPAFALMGSDPRALHRIVRVMSLLLIGGILVVGPAFILKPNLAGAVSTVIESTLSKGDSQSYVERSGLDAAALDTVGATYGLGVGWGSFRSSSLIPGLLANAGLFGAVMVLALVAKIVRIGRRGCTRSPGHPGQILGEAFSAALCGQFGAALLSAPMISSLVFYLQLGCVVGVFVRMSGEFSRDTRPGMPGVHTHGSLTPVPGTD